MMLELSHVNDAVITQGSVSQIVVHITVAILTLKDEHANQ